MKTPFVTQNVYEIKGFWTFALGAHSVHVIATSVVEAVGRTKSLYHSPRFRNSRFRVTSVVEIASGVLLPPIDSLK